MTGDTGNEEVLQMCTHQPQCPPASAADWSAAHITHAHPEQGWNRLCNGAIVFDDGGVLLPPPVVPLAA